jgi:hypothetical protein
MDYCSVISRQEASWAGLHWLRAIGPANRSLLSHVVIEDGLEKEEGIGGWRACFNSSRGSGSTSTRECLNALGAELEEVEGQAGKFKVTFPRPKAEE